MQYFSEQGASASQMTAAKVMDAIARLPDCSGKAVEEISAYTPRMRKIPKSECPAVWMRLPRHKWPKSWSNIEDPRILLERNLYGDPLAELFRERQLEEVLLELGREKVPNWDCLFVHRKQGLFLWAHVDDLKVAGKKQKMAPMWKKLMNNVILTNQFHFLFTKIWTALNVNANRTKSICRFTNFCLSN